MAIDIEAIRARNERRKDLKNTDDDSFYTCHAECDEDIDALLAEVERLDAPGLSAKQHLAVYAMAICLRKLVNMCGVPPAQEWWKSHMMQPLVDGDLVVETSMGLAYRTRNGIGWFVREVREPYPDWPEDEPNPGERVFYIRQFDDGEIVRWVNADFAKLPSVPNLAREWFETGAAR